MRITISIPASCHDSFSSTQFVSELFSIFSTKNIIIKDVIIQKPALEDGLLEIFKLEDENSIEAPYERI
jgi:hypothetical protein